MINKKAIGRLGNQMFQYATIRAFALENNLTNEKVDYDLSIHYAAGFNNDIINFNLKSDIQYKKLKNNFFQNFLIMGINCIKIKNKIFSKISKNNYDQLMYNSEKRIQPFINRFGLYYFSRGYYNFKNYNSKNKSFYGTFESYIEIEFAMDKSEGEVYTIRREWEAKSLRTNEQINVKKNGVENSFLTENWPMFVENILPSALSSFFFFDGEKIAELAVEDTSEQMKDSIKAMLGITVLDVLQSDLGRIISRISKKSANNQDLQKLEELRAIKDEAETALLNLDNELDTLQEEVKEMNTELEKLNVEYSVKGGGILEQKNQLIRQRSDSLSEINVCQEKLLDIAGGELPLLLVLPLLKDIESQSKIEHEKKIEKIALDKVTEFYQRYHKEVGVISDFIDFIQNEIAEDETIEEYQLSDMNLLQIQNLLTGKLLKNKEKSLELMNHRDSLKKNVDEIDNSLSVDINEDELTHLFEQIKSQERDIIEKQIHIDDLVKSRTSIHGKYMIAESEFSRFAEHTLATLESEDADERTVKYSHIANDIIQLYRIRLQERKTDILAKTMTDCYHKLANKKNLVNRIVMDSETLDLQYLDSNGDEVAKKRLSAGEKQLMVISLLWALAICSKKKLPVIIDTPLSRLDSSHRKALIKTYFPKASDQTIILSTDSEIDEKYYLMMKDSVGDEFTLQYDDEHKNTSIKDGYFGWGGKLA